MAKGKPWRTALETGRLGHAGATVATMVYILFGPIVWTIHFTVIYGFQSAGCALTGYIGGFGGVIGVVAITAITAAALLAATLWPGRLERLLGADGWPRQLHTANRIYMRLLAGLSIFAILASGLTPLIIPVCTSLR